MNWLNIFKEPFKCYLMQCMLDSILTDCAIQACMESHCHTWADSRLVPSFLWNGTSLCECEVGVGTSVCACVWARSSCQGDGTCLLAWYDSGCGGREHIVSDDDNCTGNKVLASDVCTGPHTRMLRVRNANKVSHLSLMLQQAVVWLQPAERVRIYQPRLALFPSLTGA